MLESSSDTCVKYALPAHSPIAQTFGALVSRRSFTRMCPFAVTSIPAFSSPMPHSLPETLSSRLRFRQRRSLQQKALYPKNWICAFGISFSKCLGYVRLTRSIGNPDGGITAGYAARSSQSQELVQRDGQVANTFPRRMEDCVGDGGRYSGDSEFADSTRT